MLLALGALQPCLLLSLNWLRLIVFDFNRHWVVELVVEYDVAWLSPGALSLPKEVDLVLRKYCCLLLVLLHLRKVAQSLADLECVPLTLGLWTVSKVLLTCLKRVITGFR